MKKMTAGLAGVLVLAACGADDGTTDTTGTATENAAEQQMTADQANGQENDAASDSSTAGDAIREFDLDLEAGDGEDWEFDYDRDEEASIEREGGDNLSGQEARDEFESLFESVQFSTDRPLEEIKSEVLDAVGASQADVRDFEMDVRFESGEAIEFDHDSRNGTGNDEINEFSLDLEFAEGEEASYDYESDGREAEIERQDGSEVEGSEAAEEMERLLKQVNITGHHSIDEVKTEVLDALAMDVSQVKDFDLEISYQGGGAIKIGHETP